MGFVSLIVRPLMVITFISIQFYLALPVTGQDKNSHINAVEKPKSSDKTWRINLKLKTLGGQQFWTDLRHASGWRIQRNEVSGHHRLLDSENYRIAAGTYERCESALEEALTAGDAKVHEGKVVIVLHGLIRSRRSMSKMAKHLEKSGYEVINVEYASTRKEVAVHAKALESIVEHLGSKVTEIHFVAHSMGNLVIRHYLADTESATGKQGDSRIGRIVMIGPPNQGSRMARILKNNFLFTSIAGASGVQLSTRWEDLESRLATPVMEFGIVAGAQSEERKRWSNFVLDGPDDFTVSFEETRLPGATDTLTMPLLHSTMMKQPAVLKATESFLRNGFFISKAKKTPIPAATGKR